MTASTHAMSSAAFKSAVASIKTRGNNLSRDIHKACVAAMIFSGTDLIGGDKNATPALQLVQALAPGLPRNKVVNWFNYFTNVRITVSKAKDGSLAWSVKNLSPTHDEYQELDTALLAAAIDLPYWDLMPESDIKEVDVTALINAAIKRIEKAQTDGKLKANPANEQRIKGLRALVSATATQEVPF